jgi:purine-binding chemotaxis protein CheW
VHKSLGQQSSQPTRTLDVVQDYLDSLLREVSLSVIEADAKIAPVAEQATPSSIRRDSSQTHASLEVPVNVTVIPAEPISVISIAANPVAGNSVAVNTIACNVVRSAARERAIPDWGRQGFAALLFEVAGIKMAAPLHSLGGISLIENNLQTVAAQADWFMGILRWNDRNLRVVDTAKFIMPERIKDDSHRASYQSVIVLGDSHWALAVDQAEKSTRLGAGDVRWKHLLGTRPWLAGTLLHRLCALMDADCMLSLLIAADNSALMGTQTQ